MARFIYRVYCNDEFVGETDHACKVTAKAWIRRHVRDTHMAQWQRGQQRGDWLYHTTIGRTYKFARFRIA